jgi:hypothetical protein
MLFSQQVHDFARSLLFVAHPGHELLVLGWLMMFKPVVGVLTDGSGHTGESRLPQTAARLSAIGASRAPVFGAFTDAQLYEVVLEQRLTVLAGVVDALTELLVSQQIRTVVTDAMEGFNPAHDLCRMLIGVACERAGLPGHYEYAIDAGPHAFSDPSDWSHEIDDVTLDLKLAAGEELRGQIREIEPMVAQHGREAFRRESLRFVEDWSAVVWPAGERPLYETIGEARVAEGHYSRVLRYEEHVRPLLDHLRVAKSCRS